ncbi:MAG: insulinase family protein [Candidatus Protochlamydia sp.]|nr:insulinase family protein [Candidatus Protochlamydia sp.]
MNRHSFFYKSVSFLALSLAACHPLIHAAIPTNPVETLDEISSSAIPESIELINGLIYTAIPSHTPYTTIELSIAIPPGSETENRPVALLAQRACFYGTSKLSREEIHEKLDCLGLDIHPDAITAANEQEHVIRISFVSKNFQHTQAALHLIQQIAFEPLLDSDAIEAARNHILDTDEAHDKEKAHKLSAVTYDEVKAFHSRWYHPSLMHLSLLIPKNDFKVDAEVADLFSIRQDRQNLEEDLALREGKQMNKMWMSLHKNLSPVDQESPLDGDYLLNIQVNSNQNYSIVDGKIWLTNPNWINKSSNGHAYGALLSAIGIGAIALTISFVPAVLPVALAAGSLTAFSGFYLLNCSYLKDPIYVEEKRQEDLKMGFAHAYRNNRAGITLTPYERRPLFLNQMINAQDSLSSIVRLADHYDLSRAVIAELFSNEEMAFLVQTKLQFLQYRNQCNKLIENLDKELYNLTVPYANIRNNNLAHAKNVYHQNVFVNQKIIWKKQLEENISLIDANYKNGHISLEKRNETIIEHKKAYQASLNENSFAAGLAFADSSLTQMETDILITYDLQVSQCKQAMQYDLRKEQFKNGKETLTYQCDAALRQRLVDFPLYIPSLPDYVDLRETL